MEEDLLSKPHFDHKRKDKPCLCAHHSAPSQKTHNTYSCVREFIPNNNGMLPCNLRSCKMKKFICLCKERKLPEEYETEDFLTNRRKVTQVRNNSDVNTQKNITNKSVLTVERTQSSVNKADVKSSKIGIGDKISIDNHEKNDIRMNNNGTSTRDEMNEFKEVENDPSVQNPMHTVQTIDETETNESTRESKNEVEEFEYTTKEECTQDAKIIEEIRKDLLNERKRTKELEEKLESLTCSMNCLKADQEQKATCLKEAIQSTEGRAKLATTSRDLAMDLVKQSREQADVIKVDRDKSFNKQLAEVTCTNTALTQERDDLKRKLEVLSENEAKRCGDVEEEVSKIKFAFKEKESALNREKEEFKEIISELTNVTKIQKKKVNELIDICNNQKCKLQEKQRELYQKNNQLKEYQNAIKHCQCQKLQETIVHLEHTLGDKSKACECLKEELELLKENSSSELRIKEKIIEEQTKTLTRQRKLLHDTERMAEQAAYEFDQLKTELYSERERNDSLQITLDQMDSQLNRQNTLECENCKILKDQMDHLNQEKDQTLAATKLAIQKLYQSAWQYQNQLVNEREQNRCLTLTLQKKEMRIEYLRRQICQHCNAFNNHSSK